jgi:hypothetical protein
VEVAALRDCRYSDERRRVDGAACRLTAPAAQVALVQSLTPLLTAAFGEQLLDAVSGRCADAFDRSIDNRPPQPFDEDRFHDRNSLLHPGAETEEAGNKGRAGL